jgi:translation initiation factor IF-3
VRNQTHNHKRTHATTCVARRAHQVRQAQKFLSKGAKVKLTMTFSGREMRFKDQGKEMMLVRALPDVCTRAGSVCVSSLMRARVLAVSCRVVSDARRVLALCACCA